MDSTVMTADANDVLSGGVCCGAKSTPLYPCKGAGDTL
jgi:hypothetical protein